MKKQTSEIVEGLINLTYKGKDPNVLFDQYKLYVESMDKISERRYQANSFFLLLHTVLISSITGFLSLSNQSTTRYGWIFFATIAGIVLSYTWYHLIQSYKQLNTGKFKIIHALEELLPVKIYSYEWEVLKHGDGTVYKPFSHIEILIPIVFGLFYGVIIIVLLVEIL